MMHPVPISPVNPAGSVRRRLLPGNAFAVLGFLLVSGVIVAVIAMAYVFVYLPDARLAAHLGKVAGATYTRSLPVVPLPTTPVPVVTPVSGILLDVDSATVLWEKNALQPRPIASLTKLVSAVTWLNTNPKLDAYVTIPSDIDQAVAEAGEPGDVASKVSLQPGERVRAKDLLASAIIASANNALLALVRSTGSVADFTQEMAQSAADAHTTTLTVADPTGLDRANVASAKDIALLAHQAFQNPVLKPFFTQAQTRITTAGGRTFTARSTDELVRTTRTYTVVGAKTGYLPEAGYTFAVEAKKDDRKLVLVLLGEPNSAARFADADALLQWGFSAT
ncbi:MAG: serine hydrolase [Patescibacteria group bacterium]|jgi:D-alanyl-D-alanine carboxypeptidase